MSVLILLLIGNCPEILSNKIIDFNCKNTTSYKNADGCIVKCVKASQMNGPPESMQQAILKSKKLRGVK